MGIFKIQYRHNQIFITVMAIIEPAQSGSNISIPVLTPKWISLKTGMALKIGKHKPIIKLFQGDPTYSHSENPAGSRYEISTESGVNIIFQELVLFWFGS